MVRGISVKHKIINNKIAFPVLLVIGLLLVFQNSFSPVVADINNKSNPSNTNIEASQSRLTPNLRPKLYNTTSLKPPIGYYAMIASSTECTDFDIGGLRFDGSSPSISVNIYGGDIISNACIVVSNLEAHLPMDTAYCVGESCYLQDGEGSLETPPKSIDEPLDASFLGIPEPQCEGLPIKGSHEGGGTIEPGQYTFIRVGSGDILTLEPGLYCLENDFTVLGGGLFGDEVTINMQDGDFLSNGDSTIHLYAPPYAVKPENGIPNILIYFENSSHVRLQGTGGSIYFGTVYSPSRDSNVMLGGESEIDSYNIQIIAGTIHVEPEHDFNIIFDPEHGYP